MTVEILERREAHQSAPLCTTFCNKCCSKLRFALVDCTIHDPRDPGSAIVCPVCENCVWWVAPAVVREPLGPFRGRRP